MTKIIWWSKSQSGGIMNILKLVVIAWGITFAFSAGAASKATESSKPEIKTRDAASGLPTGKRQHKPVSSSLGKPRDAASGMPTGKRQHKPLSSGVDNDCDGLTAAACKKKKLTQSKKGYDHYSNSSAMRANKSTKQKGDDLILRKRPGRAADNDDKGKKGKKKPLKHEK